MYMQSATGQTGGSWEIVTLYASVIDLNEFGPSEIIGYFQDEKEALKFAAGKGWYGSGHTVAVSAIRVFAENGTPVYHVISEYDIDINLAEQKRKEARKEELLQNMSEEDMDILGVKR